MKKQDSTMTQTPSSKAQRSEGINKFRIIVSSLGFVAASLVEFYFIINYSQQFIPITLLGVIMLGLIYVILSEIILYVEQMETRKSEEYENLFKSEKASYLLMRKSFRDIEEKTNMMMENASFPVEEILEKEKGIAKIIISKNKENSIVLQKMTEMLLEKVDSINGIFDVNNDSLLTKQELLMENRNKEVLSKQQEVLQALAKLNMDTIEKQSRVLESNRDAEILSKQQEVILQMRILEEMIRSNASTPGSQRVEYVREVVRQPEMVTEEKAFEEKEYLGTEDIKEAESLLKEEVPTLEAEEVMETESILTELSQDGIAEADILTAESVATEEVALPEELGMEFDKVDSSETVGTPELVEDQSDETELPEESQEMDTAQQELSVEEIVAMSDSLLKGENEIISNFSDNAEVVETVQESLVEAVGESIESEPIARVAMESEVVQEAVQEPVVEVISEPELVQEPIVEPIPIVEEKPAYVPPADSNKKMSPEEIAALIASMG